MSTDDPFYERMLNSSMPYAGKNIDKRPDAIFEDLKDNKWFKVKVIGKCARNIGTILKVTESSNPKYLFVKKKKGIGTINIDKVEVIQKGE